MRSIATTGRNRITAEDVYTYFRHVFYYYYRDPAHPGSRPVERRSG